MATANMSLPEIQPGDTDYPTSYDGMIAAVDAHDHTSGKGVQIPTAGIEDAAISAAKLASNAVTTAKILDANVTRAKLAALGQQVASPSTFTTTSSSLVDVTGMTVSITSTGRPIMVIVCGQISAERAAGGGVGDVNCTLALLRGATQIQEQRCMVSNWDASAGSVTIRFPISIIEVDAQSAGTYTYKLQAKADPLDTNTTVNVLQGTKIHAFEIG